MLSAQDTVYFGVVLQRPDCRPHVAHRSTNAGAYVVPGLWFDLDLATGAHAASALPATTAEALPFLHGLQAPPSLILHTGGGLHPYWLFKEPYVITSAAEHAAIMQLSKQFHYTVGLAGKAQGWTFDSLGDLAHVLRPAGTINYKYGTRVEVIHEDGDRYNPSDFDWLEAIPEPARATHGGAAIPGQPDLVAIAEHYGTSLERKSEAELAGAHPQHGSSTGDNFNVNVAKGLWHCWRHGTGGDGLALIAVCENLIPCEEMRAGALRGETFRRVVEIANTTFHAGIVLEADKRRNGDTPGPEPDPPLPYSDYTNALAFVRDHGADLRYCYPVECLAGVDRDALAARYQRGGHAPRQADGEAAGAAGRDIWTRQSQGPDGAYQGKSQYGKTQSPGRECAV